MNQTNSLITLFENYYSDLRNLIASKYRSVYHEADDIVQDAFHNILRIDNFDSIENPKAYLYQAASNLALNRIRNKNRRESYAESFFHEELDLISPERAFTAKRELHEVQTAFSQLPEKYQRTFLLSRTKQKSYQEISQELNIPVSTVEKHIIKTLKHLRNHLAVTNQGVHHE